MKQTFRRKWKPFWKELFFLQNSQMEIYQVFITFVKVFSVFAKASMSSNKINYCSSLAVNFWWQLLLKNVTSRMFFIWFVVSGGSKKNSSTCGAKWQTLLTAANPPNRHLEIICCHFCLSDLPTNLVLDLSSKLSANQSANVPLNSLRMS